MAQQLQILEDLATLDDEYIDCYVSTNVIELVDPPEDLPQIASPGILYSVGFTEYVDHISSEDYGIFFDQSTVKNPKTGIEIDCVDISLEEALKMQKQIGFMAMSRFRLYVNRSPRIADSLVSIFKALNEERQNMYFLNPTRSTAYKHLSEYY